MGEVMVYVVLFIFFVLLPIVIIYNMMTGGVVRQQREGIRARLFGRPFGNPNRGSLFSVNL
jgi:hypothetical protein